MCHSSHVHLQAHAQTRNSKVKILQRNANLDGTSANAGPPPEQARVLNACRCFDTKAFFEKGFAWTSQDIPLDVPKKTKLFDTQNYQTRKVRKRKNGNPKNEFVLFWRKIW